MNRAMKRGLKGVGMRSMGMTMVNSMLAQYGVSSSIARMVSAEYSRVAETLKSKGLDPDEDMFISLVAATEAFHGIVPDKVQYLIPYIQGNRPIPSSIPEPFAGILKGGLMTARAAKMLRKQNGDRILEIYNYTEAQLERIVDELGG